MYHHYYLQRPDIGIPHVKIGIISKKQWKVADFYKRKLDSNIGNCIIILTEPTTPLIFHAQPGGTFSFMGCFMYQYPKQILTIEQQVQSYVDAGMEITSYEDVEKVLKTIGFYRLRGYSFHLYDNTTKKYKADYERNKKSQPEYSEKTCTGIRDAIKAGICSDANKK